MAQRNEETPNDESWRGKIGGLESDELTAFLSEGNFARVACLDDQGWPYVVPAWHEWDGTSFWLVARKRSKWAEYMAANERCAVSIDEDDGLRKVVAQCRAVIVEEPNLGGQWVAIAERMSTRYLGPNGPKYMVPTLDKPRWLIRLDPINMQTWQGVEWANRYKD